VCVCVYIYIYIWPLSKTPYTGLEAFMNIIIFWYVFAHPMAICFLSYGRRHLLKRSTVESARKVHGGGDVLNM